MKVTKREDLVRLLNLIPYFHQHPNYSTMEAARDLGQNPQQILKDLKTLWMCGRPGLGPGDLVDLVASHSGVVITNDQGLNRPLRLTRLEAAALLLILEDLETVPGMEDKKAVVSAASKLREIMGVKAGVVFDSDASKEIDARSEEKLNILKQAIQDRQQIGFHYSSVRSNTSKSRIVEPIRIFSHESEIYVAGWDTADEEYKHFRVDRISQLEVREESVESFRQAPNFDPADPFQFSQVDEQAEISLRPEASWMSDFYPMHICGDYDDGRIQAFMPISSKDWFYRFLLANADRITVVGPDTLVRGFAHYAHKALTSYSDNTASLKKG